MSSVGALVGLYTKHFREVANHSGSLASVPRASVNNTVTACGWLIRCRPSPGGGQSG